MPRILVNGIQMYVERPAPTGRSGSRATPVVLVHGGWTDHTSWDGIVAAIAREGVVVRYDRRGHSRTERPAGPGSRRTDEDDLAALIEHLDLGPVHLVGSSFGASISLGLAARRPELARSVAAHEPPLFDAVGPGHPDAAEVARVRDLIADVARQVRDGDHAGAAARFVDEVAGGPGGWASMPGELRHALVANAPMIVDVLRDQGWAAVPPSPPASVPVLLTGGSASPPCFAAILDALVAGSHRSATRRTIEGAAHAPHRTHPSELVVLLRSFHRAAAQAAPSRRDDGQSPSR